VTTHDDDLDFDFFEEPETQEAPRSERPRAPRAPRRASGGRGPMRPPAGVTPLLRLVGLVAFAIVLVVLIVFWVQSCQSDRKREAYRDYMQQVAAVAQDSAAVGRELSDLLTTPGLNQQELQRQLASLIQQHQLVVARGERLDPPGPLRPLHQNVIEALQFRVSGLRGLSDAFARTAQSDDANRAGALLAEQAQRLVTSDVVWDDLFRAAAADVLNEQGITGVQVPESNFVQTADLASTRSMIPIWQRITGAQGAGGTPTGLHGNSIGAVRVLPGGTQLSQTTETTVEASTDLAFVAAVTNSGDSQEVQVEVTLTIPAAAGQTEPIEKKQTIDLINPGETKEVTFRDFPQVPFGEKVNIRVDVDPVPGEKNLSNNSAEFPVIFSLGS
jgi:hypothetical protein